MNNVAFKINDDQLNVLAYLTGFSVKELEANLGWYLVRAGGKYVRWQIMPRHAIVKEYPNVILYDEYKSQYV